MSSTNPAGVTATTATTHGVSVPAGATQRVTGATLSNISAPFAIIELLYYEWVEGGPKLVHAAGVHKAMWGLITRATVPGRWAFLPLPKTWCLT